MDLLKSHANRVNAGHWMLDESSANSTELPGAVDKTGPAGIPQIFKRPCLWKLSILLRMHWGLQERKTGIRDQINDWLILPMAASISWSLARSLSTLRIEWRTVVWCLPPKSWPI